MATPPKLPPDAFKQPGQEMESPWDTQSSAPAPKARKQQSLALPQWAGRYPIAQHDHSTQLDMDAAVNEFGLKMPREQAEDEAYRQYLYHPQRGQHAEAAMHHLRGMKAAHAAGDMDSARKHSLMFNLHAKALGKQPHEAAAALQLNTQKMPEMHKFKAHRGDAFAVNQPPPQQGTGVISSSPPPQLNKREQEVLHMLYLMSMAALKKGEVVGEIPGPTPPKQPKGKKQGWNDLDSARAKGWAHAQGLEPYELKGDKPEKPTKKAEKSGTINVPRKPLREGTFAKDRLPKVMVEGSKHCKCDAYHFPHRHGGGKCSSTK